MVGTGKKKIEIKKIQESEKRFVTFCKRRKGLFKKVEELVLLTGCRLAALVFSPAAEKPHTSGDMSLMDQYISDTSAEQLSINFKPESIDVEAALQIHASRKLEDISDLNELTGMKSELQMIRNTLLHNLCRFDSANILQY